MTNPQDNASKTYVVFQRRSSELFWFLWDKIKPTPDPQMLLSFDLYQLYAESEELTSELSRIMGKPYAELIACLEADIEKGIEGILHDILDQVGTLRGEERTIYENTLYTSTQDILKDIDREQGESKVKARLYRRFYPADHSRTDFFLALSYDRLDEYAYASFEIPNTEFVEQTLIPKIRESLEVKVQSDQNDKSTKQKC